jgi:hypothetical protein
MTNQISLTVNGQSHTLDAIPGETFWLRLEAAL